jgi:tetratricopeptide (TPR) repeat protein
VEAVAALRKENELLKKLAEAKSAAPAAAPATPGNPNQQLAEAQAQLAALQSDREIWRLEKVALENRIRQLAASPVSTRVIPAPADPARMQQLERERDDLQKKLELAQKDLYGRNGQKTAAQVEELTGQLDVLRARLAVYEARQVAYTPEELALFKKPEMTLPVTDPNAGKKPARELPAGTMSLVAEAQRDFAARRFDKAEEKYLEVLRRDNQNVNTLANLAAIQLEANHLEDAEKHLKEALAVAPEDAYSLSILGNLKYRQAKYDEALDVLSRAAKLEPQNPEVQNYLGLTLSQKGMRQPAETALRKAIQLQPKYGSAHNNLAVIYATQNPPSMELARWHYQRALDAGFPRNSDLERLLDGGKTADAGR